MPIENAYLETQVINQIKMVRNFSATCKLAAIKDDGITSKEEQKILDAIDKESEKYINKLMRLL